MGVDHQCEGKGTSSARSFFDERLHLVRGVSAVGR